MELLKNVNFMDHRRQYDANVKKHKIVFVETDRSDQYFGVRAWWS
jgi:hypothetical protein